MKTPDIRKIDFEIPIYWTSEQALAVFELIDDLREKILGYYRLQIHEQMAVDREPDDMQSNITEKDIPF
jgi:hypothetical protein